MSRTNENPGTLAGATGAKANEKGHFLKAEDSAKRTRLAMASEKAAGGLS